MSGFGVLVWIAIGAAAGWALSRLMVAAEDIALRGTAAGMIGAALAPLGMRLLDSPPAIASTNLTASVAALAGALWLTWITCVVTSARRPRTDLSSLGLRTRPPDLAPDSIERPAVLTYAAARNQLVDQLLRDAMAHDAGRYDEIGRRFDTIEHQFPHGAAPGLGRLHVALTFWDGWIDARDAGWRLGEEITKAEWPLLARYVAADLEGDRDITDARIVGRFDAAAHRSPGIRALTLAARLRAN